MISSGQSRSPHADLITIDPERDTTPKLDEYVKHFSSRIVGLTGTPEEIAAAAKAYRVYYNKVPNKVVPGDYTMDHTAIIYLMDATATTSRTSRRPRPRRHDGEAGKIIVVPSLIQNHGNDLTYQNGLLRDADPDGNLTLRLKHEGQRKRVALLEGLPQSHQHHVHAEWFQLGGAMRRNLYSFLRGTILMTLPSMRLSCSMTSSAASVFTAISRSAGPRRSIASYKRSHSLCRRSKGEPKMFNLERPGLIFLRHSRTSSCSGNREQDHRKSWDQSHSGVPPN